MALVGYAVADFSEHNETLQGALQAAQKYSPSSRAALQLLDCCRNVLLLRRSLESQENGLVAQVVPSKRAYMPAARTNRGAASVRTAPKRPLIALPHRCPEIRQVPGPLRAARPGGRRHVRSGGTAAAGGHGGAQVRVRAGAVGGRASGPSP
ncbi:hypothetical protein B484DRAFT_80703 [Ochromonadaceae sp. CCMP2298]|nr:hypothetical protein B484DRAFT_80703 [Ochromonadaceae sp. CCMP2298]